MSWLVIFFFNISWLIFYMSGFVFVFFSPFFLVNFLGRFFSIFLANFFRQVFVWCFFFLFFKGGQMLVPVFAVVCPKVRLGQTIENGVVIENDTVPHSLSSCVFLILIFHNLKKFFTAFPFSLFKIYIIINLDLLHHYSLIFFISVLYFSCC